MENLKDKIFSHIVFKNAFWLYLSEIIARGSRFVIFVLITKYLGPKNFGIFEYIFSFIGIFFLFADFGASNIFIRDYQQQEEKEKHINLFFWLKFFLSVIFSFLAILGYSSAKRFDGFLLYLLLVIFYFLTSFETFFENYFIATQKAEKKFVFNTFMSLSLFVFVLIALMIRPSVFSVVLAYALSPLLSLPVGYYLFIKDNKIKFTIDFSLVKYYLFNGLPLALFGLLGYIFFATDKIILAHLRPIEEVGYYSLASRILGVLFCVSSLFNTALYPYLAKKVSEKHKILNSLFSMMIGGSMVAGFVVALFCFLVSPIVFNLFFSNYVQSIPIFQLFVWILIFVYPTTFLDYFLISNHKQWLDFGITILPAILNIILNLIFIPKFGAFGAVYASIISQFINFILTLIASIFVMRKLNFNTKI